MFKLDGDTTRYDPKGQPYENTILVQGERTLDETAYKDVEQKALNQLKLTHPKAYDLFASLFPVLPGQNITMTINDDAYQAMIDTSLASAWNEAWDKSTVGQDNAPILYIADPMPLSRAVQESLRDADALKKAQKVAGDIKDTVVSAANTAGQSIKSVANAAGQGAASILLIAILALAIVAKAK